MDQFHTCSNPRLVYNKYIKRTLQVNCGCCPSCLCRKITRYVPDLVRESFSWKYSIFFTLTYSDEFLPLVDVNSYRDNIKPQYLENYDFLLKSSSDYVQFKEGFLPVLRYSDVQKFVKRLRKKISSEFSDYPQIRYAISGDYGSTTFRPHYHGMLFFSDERLVKKISSYISDAWSIKSEFGRFPIGRIDVQHAYGAAQYVSAYISTDSERPVIYQFRDFRAKMLHSSSPSLGSLVRPVEEVREIVKRGLTKIHIYDPVSFAFRSVPVAGSLKRRLFPTISGFSRLGRVSRLELYRIVQRTPESKSHRLTYLHHLLKVNSFFHDYIYDSSCYLSTLQLLRKLDSFYYTCKRFLLQADSLGYSPNDYDFFIEQFNNNKRYESLKSQLEFERSFVLRNGKYDNAYFDISKLSDNDNLDNHFVVSDSLYFSRSLSRLNSLIKRKCDNAYLDSHPEFKKFHS